MKIVLVIDQFDNSDNGTTVTARRYAQNLRMRGHQVTVLAGGEPYDNKVCAPQKKIPFFEGLVESQGMKFAKPCDPAYYEAFKGADIVHFYLPFSFCSRGEQIARQMGIPTVAAFHCQPENITSTIGLAKSKAANDLLYSQFNKRFYNRFYHIHCPSRFIADELTAHGYTAKLHVISNGVADSFVPQSLPKKSESDGLFRIIMCGRLSVEKRQDIIIDAVLKSRHADRIKLIFAGKGPLENEYRKRGAALANGLQIGFFSSDELCRVFNTSDLYVHASDAEIEGIGCMEALASGLVPVISNSPLSAAWQYALDDRSIFNAGDSSDLAEKIDYWFEHRGELSEMSPRYAELMNHNRVSDCVAKAEEMYAEAIADYKKNGPRPTPRSRFKRLTTPNPESTRKRFCKTGRFKSACFTVLTAMLSPLIWLIARLGMGLKVEGKANLLSAGPAITVSNHVHPLDCLAVKCGAFPRPIRYLSLESNLQIPFVGWLIRWLGAVPLAGNVHGAAELEAAIGRHLELGEMMQIYPEGMLVPGCSELRAFKPGAFHAAVRLNRPVVPAMFCRRRKRNGRQGGYTLRIGSPIWPDSSLGQKSAINDLAGRARLAMLELQTGRKCRTRKRKAA